MSRQTFRTQISWKRCPYEIKQSMVKSIFQKTQQNVFQHHRIKVKQIPNSHIKMATLMSTNRIMYHLNKQKLSMIFLTCQLMRRLNKFLCQLIYFLQNHKILQQYQYPMLLTIFQQWEKQMLFSRYQDLIKNQKNLESISLMSKLIRPCFNMKNKGYLNLLLKDIILKNNENEKEIQKIENPLKSPKMIS